MHTLLISPQGSGHLLKDEQGLALDKNTFSDITDYELEIESSSMDHAQEAVKNILESCNITSFEFNNVSKQARALNALKK